MFVCAGNPLTNSYFGPQLRMARRNDVSVVDCWISDLQVGGSAVVSRLFHWIRPGQLFILLWLETA